MACQTKIELRQMFLSVTHQCTQRQGCENNKQKNSMQSQLEKLRAAGVQKLLKYLENRRTHNFADVSITVSMKNKANTIENM